MLLKFTLLTLCWFISLAAYAQPDAPAEKGRYLLRISPQHLFFRGYHLDIEKQLKAGGKQSLVLSPRVYSGNTSFADSFTRRSEEPADHSRVKGFGLELQHRLYLNDLTDSYDRNYYLGYGVNFHRFDIRFQKAGYEEVLHPDGLYYYQYTEDAQKHKEKVNRWGVIAYLGRQESFITDRLLIDFHVGLGYNSSSNSSTYPSNRFDRNFMDYGYTGFYFYPGLKFAFIL